MRKWQLVGGAAVAVMIAVFALPQLINPSQGSVSAQDVETGVVERTDLNTSIESSGTIAPAQSMTMMFGTSGIVESVNVDIGDSVQVGQVLAELNTADLEYQIRLKEQSFIVQENNYNELMSPATSEQIAQAQANLASAQAQLLSAQNSLNTAPNSTTINCADVEDRLTVLEDAQQVWDDYVISGYEMDAAFLPDNNSSAGTTLRDARRAYDVAVAQCNNTTPVTQYETQLVSAQASVDQAQAALDSLLAGPTAEEIASAEAQLEQARLELENARAALEDAQIVALFSGVVSAVDIQVGEAVSSNTAAINIVDTSALHVDVDVDEVDIPQIEIGQAANIMPEALEDVILRGEVSRIAPAGTSSNGVVTFSVRIDLSELGSQRIYAGMTTDVEIVTGSEAGVLVVPTDAIQRSGTTEFVELLNADGTTQQVNVSTGTTIDGMTVIDGNVDEGATVVIPADESPTLNGFAGPFGG